MTIEITKPVKIISGGQNGADLAGLEAAKLLGMATGGTAPKGWRVQDFYGNDSTNPKLSEFGLKQHKKQDYPPRTIENVKHSDGMVWFGYASSPGGSLTINTAKRLNKPVIINPAYQQLALWVKENRIVTLNVAGNVQSELNPQIFELTFGTILAAFTIGIG